MKKEEEGLPEKNKSFKEFVFNSIYQTNKGKKDLAQFFFGKYKNETNNSGHKIVMGKLELFEFTIWSMAENRSNLNNYLDIAVEMVILNELDYESAVKSKIAGSEFYHN